MKEKILKLFEKPVEQNPVDRAIVNNLPGVENQEVNEVYKARWVWYHTILAVELFFTNILLLLILFVLAFK
jgi:hypothetical protein